MTTKITPRGVNLFFVAWCGVWAAVNLMQGDPLWFWVNLAVGIVHGWQLTIRADREYRQARGL